MQRSIEWWDTLTETQRSEVLAMGSGGFEEWVLDSMEVAGIRLATATVDGKTWRLPPTMTTDFLEGIRQQARK